MLDINKIAYIQLLEIKLKIVHFMKIIQIVRTKIYFKY
jgi:hypothetical protein